MKIKEGLFNFLYGKGNVRRMREEIGLRMDVLSRKQGHPPTQSQISRHTAEVQSRYFGRNRNLPKKDRLN